MSKRDEFVEAMKRQLDEMNEQIDQLINYAQSIEGRNLIKANYIRRKDMIGFFSRVKEEAVHLIHQINISMKKNN